MLPPDESPVHLLVSKWWKSRPPFPHELIACRTALFTAAVHELCAHAAASNAYDPLSDRRFLWAIQWLDLASGSIRRIDPAIQASASIYFDPPRALDRKQLAAGG